MILHRIVYIVSANRVEIRSGIITTITCAKIIGIINHLEKLQYVTISLQYCIVLHTL
jgi:hypothetical protein